MPFTKYGGISRRAVFTAFSIVICFLAACGGGSGNQQLPPAAQLVSISIAPSNPTLSLGINQAFTATGTYSDNTTKDLTSAVQWKSVDNNIVWLNNSGGRNGIATPRGTGGVSVQAGLNGVTGSTSVTVTALSSRFAYVANQDDGTLSSFVLNAGLGGLHAKEYLYLGHVTPVAMVTDPASHFLFLLDSSSDSVWSYVVNSVSGRISPAPGSPFKSGSGSNALAVDPQGALLFVANQSAGSVSVFSIDTATGALNAVVGSPFSAGSGTAAVAVHPTARFLYAANPLDNNVTAFLIGSAGSLTPVTGSPFITGHGPVSLAVDATGQYLYTADAGASTVSAFSVDGTTGALKPLAGSPYSAGSNPVSLSFEPGGKYLYVANRGSASSLLGSISTFAVNPDDGTLTTSSATPNTGSDPRSIIADPSGNALYLINHGSHDVWSFSLNRQTGALSLLQTTRARTGPVSMTLAVGKNAVSVTPTFAYAVGAGASAIGAYSVDPSTSALTEISTSPVGTAGASISIAAAPSGKFLFVGNTWMYKLSAYSIDSNTGALAPVSGSPYSFPGGTSGPFMILPEPSGRFLYMTNGYDVLTAMVINESVGGLAPVAWGPVKITDSLPWGPSGFAIDPAGRFLYVADSIDAVSGYRINPADGSLTALPDSPLMLDIQGNWLQSITIDPTGKYLYVPVRCSSWSQTCTDHGLFGFEIDPNDGHLTPLPGSPWKTSVTDFPSIAIDANGRFLYIVDGGQGLATTTGTYGFTIDPTTGALNPMAGSPFSPSGYAFLNPDPTGNVLYGGDETGIRVYHIDPTSGALTVTQDMPFSAGGPVWSVTVNSVLK